MARLIYQSAMIWRWEVTFQLRSPAGKRLVTEAVTADLAIATLLCGLSACLVSAFGCKDYDPTGLAFPGYAQDTTGFTAFIVAAICVATSEYPAATEASRAERNRGVRGRGSRVAPALSSAPMSLYTEISYLDFMLPLVACRMSLT